MSLFQLQVLAAFFLLIAVCAGLLIYSDQLGAVTGNTLAVVASHGFTFSLGSAVGALIAMTGSRAFSNG